MPNPFPELNFTELRERLLRAGIAPRHIRRYLAELTDHLTDLTAEEQHSGLCPAAAQSAALLRLGSTDNLAAAMIAQPRLQSLAARAPWAVFSLTPLLLLATLWFVAVCLLRLGWHHFLPGAPTPFGSRPGHHTLFEPSNIYFQLDRALFFGAPVLVGWCMGLTAARQRLNTLWPICSLALLGLFAATVGVRAYPSALPTGFGHIRLSFAFRSVDETEYALLVVLFASLPYLIWRLKTALSLPA